MCLSSTIIKKRILETCYSMISRPNKTKGCKLNFSYLNNNLRTESTKARNGWKLIYVNNLKQVTKLVAAKTVYNNLCKFYLEFVILDMSQRQKS